MYKDQIIYYGTGLALALLFLILSKWMSVRLKKQTKVAKKIIYHGLTVTPLVLCVLTIYTYYNEAAAEFKFTPIVSKIVDIAMPLLIAFIILRQLFELVNLLENRQINKGEDKTSARVFSRALKMLSTLIVTLLLAHDFGLNLSALMAFGGMGGLVVGLAAKDTLSNFFSGILLFYDRQFNIGDWISSPDRNIQGTVVEIGWRLTKIMTFDHRPLYVPNALFSTISVENPGRMTNRRIKTSISLRYEDAAKISAVVSDIKTMLKNNEDIDQSQTMLVYFDEFGDSSLNILIYCFTKTTVWAKWLEAQQTVFLNIIDIVHQHGADFAFDSTTVYLKKDD